jgi:hypothetical protein
MAIEAEFSYESVQIRLGDLPIRQEIFIAGIGTITKSFTHVLWPGSQQWEDATDSVLESVNLEAWKESARQYIRDRRVEIEDLKAMQAATGEES